jgi:hypothetical protein
MNPNSLKAQLRDFAAKHQTPGPRDTTRDKGRRQRRTAYVWVYIGMIITRARFDLTAGRRQEFRQRFLAGHRRFIHDDA